MSVTPAAMKIASATQRSHRPPSRMLCQYISATTTGTAAMRAYVNRFGTASGRAGSDLELMAFIVAKRTPGVGKVNRTKCTGPQRIRAILPRLVDYWMGAL